MKKQTKICLENFTQDERTMRKLHILEKAIITNLKRIKESQITLKLAETYLNKLFNEYRDLKNKK